jgi:ATP-dependent Lon protease
MFSEGYGFVVDYLAEILRHMRDYDVSQAYADHFQLMNDISTRDRTAIQKTFSGLMKLIFPHGEATHAEIEELLRFAIEGRKRVKDQLMRIDTTYAPVSFAYTDQWDGTVTRVQTLEERTYPQYYGSDDDTEPVIDAFPEHESETTESHDSETVSGSDEGTGSGVVHRTFEENQRGVTFDDLFGPYLEGAKEIVVTDPYIRLFFQTRNMMEFVETVADHKDVADAVTVHLITGRDPFDTDPRQEEYLSRIQDAAANAGITFTWEYDDAIHARHIVTDTGWKISLDRGLDIYQRYEMNDAFDLANRLQAYRAVKAFEVTYLRVDGE